jgi:hypothetical protein
MSWSWWHMTMALSETVMHFGSVREANANGAPALIPPQPHTPQGGLQAIAKRALHLRHTRSRPPQRSAKRAPKWHRRKHHRVHSSGVDARPRCWSCFRSACRCRRRSRLFGCLFDSTNAGSYSRNRSFLCSCRWHLMVGPKSHPACERVACDSSKRPRLRCRQSSCLRCQNSFVLRLHAVIFASLLWIPSTL